MRMTEPNSTPCMAARWRSSAFAYGLLLPASPSRAGRPGSARRLDHHAKAFLRVLLGLRLLAQRGRPHCGEACTAHGNRSLAGSVADDRAFRERIGPAGVEQNDGHRHRCLEFVEHVGERNQPLSGVFQEPRRRCRPAATSCPHPLLCRGRNNRAGQRPRALRILDETFRSRFSLPSRSVTPRASKPRSVKSLTISRASLDGFGSAGMLL